MLFSVFTAVTPWPVLVPWWPPTVYVLNVEHVVPCQPLHWILPHLQGNSPKMVLKSDLPTAPGLVVI